MRAVIDFSHVAPCSARKVNSIPEYRDGPQYGNVASLIAAKQAFRAAWNRRPKAKC
jgi:hypothetical protein